jgi:diguanylate cyclase (GGDEF)-like protein/PAS domain S-box-containing protein
MDAISQALAGNFAVVALFISAWVHGQFVLAGKSRQARNAIFGAVMGMGAVATMMLAVRQESGMLLDLRSSLLALAGFFGGPLAGLIAGSIAFVYRLTLGGAAAGAGGLAILIAWLTGWLISRITYRRIPAIWSVALLAIAVACIGPMLTLFLRVTGLFPASDPSPVLALLNGTATALYSFFIMRQRSVERDRDLLRAAFVQSPDFQYVKTPDSHFAAVNDAVVKHHGFTDASQMIGKTDFDLAEPARAEELLREEQELVKAGGMVDDRIEVLSDVTGKLYWYSTSKVPLHSPDGEIIGIAGVTRDVTQEKRLEQELTDSRNQLSYVLAEITDGIAMFDANGMLVYSNEQYKTLFPRTAKYRTPGTSLRTILERVLEAGEQIIPEGTEAQWLDELSNSIHHYTEEEVELFDGRWLFIRTRPTAQGSALVVVSDVTKIKQAERALQTMTDQLKLLATTDGLTGLTNRRAFDDALEREISRARRSGEPLSLLLVDVDRFKAYNDLYGHPAGDEVLKKVGVCLKEALKRPGDVAARYGGEEFVAILPGTDEDGAFFIADAFREALFGLGIAHKGGDKGVVTASVGLATLTDRDAGVNSTELVRRADEALYNAKGAGRDRVTGWRPRREVRPVGGVRGSG